MFRAPSFSSVAKPLRQLTKPNSEFNFTEECLQAFKYLCDTLTSEPVLALYSPGKATELHCDASQLGFGAILLQKQEDGKFHPIAYFSQATTPEEGRYHSFELETLAIIYALRKFSIYLDGIEFKIITDCNALILTLERKSVNARIARWALELSNYNCSIQHRSGKYMIHVDALSRLFDSSPNLSNLRDFNNTVSVIEEDSIDIQLQITQNRDNVILQLRDNLESGPVQNYELDDGIVYRKTSDGALLLYVPSEMENNIIRIVHEKLCHLGSAKVVAEIKRFYWFPNMDKKVRDFICNCLKCIMYSVPRHANYRTLHNIPKKPIPFDTLHIDHFGPLPSIVSKKKHILVVVDAFTKFIKLYPVNTTSTIDLKGCLNKYFECYSRPRRIVSDRGSCFTSLEFSEFLLNNNIEHVKVATASPQANGQVERINRIINLMISKISEPIQHSDWYKLLTKVEYAVNNSVHATTNQTPAMLLFGVSQRSLEVDTLTEYLEDKGETSRDLDGLRNTSFEKLKTSQSKSSETHKNQYKPHEKFSCNDFVVVRNVDTTIGTNKKFIAKYKGPYVIKKVLPNDRYVVTDIENCPVTQMPYEGILEASRLRKWADWRVNVESDSEP